MVMNALVEQLLGKVLKHQRLEIVEHSSSKMVREREISPSIYTRWRRDMSLGFLNDQNSIALMAHLD